MVVSIHAHTRRPTVACAVLKRPNILAITSDEHNASVPEC
jgi:hypothetical protein